MREKILAVVDELKRRKADGETHVFVEAPSIDNLRKAVSRKAKSTQPAEQPKPAAPVHAAPQPAAPEPAYADPKPRVTRKVATTPAEPIVVAASTLPPPPQFTLPEGDKRTRWEWLRERVINCPVCNEHLNPGKQVVFGNGNIDSPIFFCGEAPGADEEEQGIPFVGKAGQLLVKIINAMGLKREEVYIGNIMNWRPQTGMDSGNRPPTDEEMSFCLPYLKAQVAVVQPRVIVALGNTALTGLLGPSSTRRITSARGNWFDFNGTPLMPTFHPSYVLRYGNATTKRQIWEDMLAVMEKVEMPISEKQRGFFKTAE